MDNSRNTTDTHYKLSFKRITTSNMNMTSEDRLKVAAQEGDINRLYAVIQQNPNVLEDIDSISFVQTPLHVAASAGHLQFATEIMRLKPSFAWKLNPQGFTPIHLALQLGHNRMVLRLVEINKDLVRAKGREGLTPLHFASQIGEAYLLDKFLKACPGSIEDINVRNETALHFAVRYQKLEALKFLVRWLETNTAKFEETILNRKDEDGNTILHIAASNNDTGAIALLIKFRMDLDAINLEGRKALDIAGSENIKRKLMRATISTNRKLFSLLLTMNKWVIGKMRVKDTMSEEERNASLVVATLIAAVTYEAVLSPPGGLYQTNANAGKSIMSDKEFTFIMSLNMSCFVTSILAIICLLPRNSAQLLVGLPAGLLLVSYLSSLSVISPSHTTVVSNIFEAFLVSLPLVLFLLSVHLLY